MPSAPRGGLDPGAALASPSVPMTPAEALIAIQGYAGAGRVRFRPHARQRLRERGAEPLDVRRSLLTATSATWQTDRDNWRVEGGIDCLGDPLTVIVEIEDGVVVVTLY